jgi:hypothetical protein
MPPSQLTPLHRLILVLFAHWILHPPVIKPWHSGGGGCYNTVMSAYLYQHVGEWEHPYALNASNVDAKVVGALGVLRGP